MTSPKTLASREDIASKGNEHTSDIEMPRENFKVEPAGIKEELSKMESRLESKLTGIKSDIMNWILFLYVITIIAILVHYLK